MSERANNRRWDAAKLRELRKRLDSGSMSVEEIDQVSEDFLDAEIVDLASDWLGNTVSPFLHPLKHMLTVLCRLCKNCSSAATLLPVSACWSAWHLISP